MTRATTIAPTPDELDALPDRAARAWRLDAATTHLGGPLYRLDDHLVDLDAGSCECSDHEYRDSFCKHLRRAAIDVTRGRVPPSDSPRITEHREPRAQGGARYTRCEGCGLEVVGFDLRRRGCWECRGDEEESTGRTSESEASAAAPSYGGNIGDEASEAPIAADGGR